MKSANALRALACLAALALLGSCGGDDPTPERVATVDHSNYDPSALSDAELGAAAGLDVYFEHASVGANIVDGIRTLGEAQSRFACAMESYSNSDSAIAWFAAYDGLVDYARGNFDDEVQKVTGFYGRMNASLAAAVDVAMFKFCYIDSPLDADTLFASALDAMDGLKAAYPAVDFVWWTMPIERDSSDAERQAYNELVRQHCSANGDWLLDIADLESHDDSGAAVLEVGTGLELLYAGYTDDGGHLNPVGAGKLALAYWRLLAEIARSR